MSKRILWLDNDPLYAEPYIDALKDEGHDVRVVATVSDAEKFLKITEYSLMIFDVMIPTKNQEEEVRYKPELTDRGLKTGLIFYIRNKKFLEESQTSVLVMTVRLDETIQAEFAQAGLPRHCFATKFSLRDVSAFLNKVRTLI